MLHPAPPVPAEPLIVDEKQMRDLPPARQVFGPWNTIVKQLQSFYS